MPKYKAGDIVQWNQPKLAVSTIAQIISIQDGAHYTQYEYKFLQHHNPKNIGFIMYWGCAGFDSETFFLRKFIDAAKIWREVLEV